MHPYRHEYPEDVVLFWQQFILDHWFDWTNRVLVATSRESEHGEEKIVGMAIWQRQGEGSKKMIPGTLDPREYKTHLCLIHTTLFTNQQFDPPSISSLHLASTLVPINLRKPRPAAHSVDGSSDFYPPPESRSRSYEGRHSGRIAPFFRTPLGWRPERMLVSLTTSCAS